MISANFRNEIVWKRTSSHGNVDRGYGDNTDTIFFYTKSDLFFWNLLYTEYSEKHVKTKFAAVDKKGRHYTTSDLRNPGLRPNLHYPYTASNGITYQPHPNGWAVSREVMEQYDREDRLYFPKVQNGRLRLKRYLDESKGHKLQTLWDDTPPINSQAQERLGYPTQKSLALLERIISASGNQGDLAVKAGFYETPYGKFPKLQILTIRELFAGAKPKLPWIDPNSFKKAAREASGVQDQLDL
jgi:site-specific DNA-methyltransferase (adenine-specific)